VVRLPATVVAAGLSVRLIDEWWSWLPAGVVEDLKRDFGISYAGSGWLLALLFVGGLVGTPLSVLADHLDRGLVALAGALAISGGLATYAIGAPFAALAAASLVLGAASDLLVAPLEAALAASAGDRLDRLIGRQHTLTFLGDFLGPGVLALGAVTALGWRGAFALTAAAIALFGGVVATIPFPPPEAPAESLREAFGETVAVARNGAVWRLVVVEMLLGPLDEPLLAFVVARAAAESPAGAQTGAALAQLLAGAGTIGGLAASALVERRGVRPALRRIGPWLMVAGTGAATLDATLAVGSLAMLAVGAGMGIVWADLHVRLLTVVPGRTATVSTLVGAVGTVGALVPALTGVLADRAGLDAALGAYTVLCLMLVVAVRALPPPEPAPGTGATAGSASG